MTLPAHLQSRAVKLLSLLAMRKASQAVQYRALKADNDGERELNEAGAVNCEQDQAIFETLLKGIQS
jgi:hypothetical protein